MRVSLLFLVGCSLGGPTLSPGFESELTARGGCGDVVFYAHDPDDTTMLVVWVDGLVADATASGEETTTTLDAADTDLRVEVGSSVSDATCDDVIEQGGPVVRNTWEATAGEVEITIVPGESEWDARGTLRLSDVELSEGGAVVELPSFAIEDVGVGWLAG